MSDIPSPDGFRIRGWHVLVALCAFFAVIIAVNAVFLTAALRTFPGEVSITPYEDGLAFNRQLAQQARQAELGWRAAARAEAGAVVVEIADAEGRPVEGLRVQGRLQRPATETGARDLRLSEQAPGLYRASLDSVMGAWDLTIQAQGPAGRDFQAERRLTWP
ncbi:FixH family protein [Phenylobacterium sp.]|uniref:FixH family protein n=1 Tax=Phenylobacterium sp. TaxID=1871053 RepID=UPI0027313E58|nr:FixH family protein [Phenylobacterium sp.]MDP1619318.1 FixH family protein [Phenylobacterium sp.]MDP1987915.1 FixH family protein [Phenylobacterium sp.]